MCYTFKYHFNREHYDKPVHGIGSPILRQIHVGRWKNKPLVCHLEEMDPHNSFGSNWVVFHPDFFWFDLKQYIFKLNCIWPRDFPRLSHDPRCIGRIPELQSSTHRALKSINSPVIRNHRKNSPGVNYTKNQEVMRKSTNHPWCMVFNGKSHSNGWVRGTSILGNLHIYI